MNYGCDSGGWSRHLEESNFTSQLFCRLFYLLTRRVARIWKRGGYFERVRKVQTTLNQFHTVCPKIQTKFLGMLGNSKVFSAQNQVVSKKKRSSPKLSLIFRPKSEIQTFEGSCFPMGGAIFNFSQQIGLKSTKNVRFCILHKPMGGARAPPGYATASNYSMFVELKISIWFTYCTCTVHVLVI